MLMLCTGIHACTRVRLNEHNRDVRLYTPYTFAKGRLHDGVQSTDMAEVKKLGAWVL